LRLALGFEHALDRLRRKWIRAQNPPQADSSCDTAWISLRRPVFMSNTKPRTGSLRFALSAWSMRLISMAL
jgi:hypothetical protein